MSLTRRRLVQLSASTLLGGLTLPLHASDKKFDVIIIGAGLAGLQAARQLEKSAANYLLLEASARSGGRIWTLDDLDGAPEAGGSQVGINYSLFRDTAKQLGVTFDGGSGIAKGMTFAVNNQLFNSENWATHPANHTGKTEKAIQPSWLLWQYLAKAPQLDNPGSWNQEKFSALDIPLKQFLLQQGASAEAIRLISCDLTGDIETISTLEVMRKLAIVQQSRGAEYVSGGTQRFTDALAKNLRNPVLHNHAVNDIHDHGNSVTVKCSNGASFTAKRVICAIPFSTARTIVWHKALSETKTALIQRLNYHPVTHVFLQPKKAFWESDKLSVNMWTDTPIGRLFSQTEKSGKIIGLRLWLNGQYAAQFDAMKPTDAEHKLLDILAAIRPSTKEAVEISRYLSWGNNPNNRGAFSWYSAGDVGKLSSAANTLEGNVHFAGEHTEQNFSGMEAALLSGQRAANEIIKALS